MTIKQSFKLRVAVFGLLLVAGIAITGCSSHDDEYLYQVWEEPETPVPDPTHTIVDWEDDGNEHIK